MPVDQIKDRETLDGNEDTNFDVIDEKDCPFGPWLRAFPLPKFSGEVKKEQTSGSCSRNLFAEESNSKDKVKESAMKEVEDNQSTGRVQAGVETRDGKNIHTREYPRIKSAT
ncbi:hypothetical protein A2U01_0046005, partial [Trifolium medium]|nr:hypothetical protein [Trifolium medium]